LSDGSAIHQESDDLASGDHLELISGIGSGMDGGLWCERNDRVADIVDHGGGGKAPASINAETVVALRGRVAKGDPEGVGGRATGLLHRYRDIRER